MKTMIQEILTMADEFDGFDLKPHAHYFRTITTCKTASFYATLNNLVEAGLLRKAVVEGKTSFRLTDEGAKRIVPVSKLPIKRRRRWDGKFRLLLFNIPEEKRKARDLLRAFLKEIGFGMLHHSVWILPYEITPEISSWLEENEYNRYVMYFVVNRFRFATAEEIFCKAWDLEGVMQRYNGFIREKRQRMHLFQGIFRGKKRMPPEELTQWMIRDLDESFTRIFQMDPFLPREFLPADWSGDEARVLYRRLRRRLQRVLKTHQADRQGTAA